MTAPVQVALRELMILTKCYCDGEHPRLGHNCSFRPDVKTLVDAITAVLKLCDEAVHDGPHPEEIRAALLGLPYVPDADAMTRDPGCPRCNYDAHRCHGCGTPLPHGIESCDGCGATENTPFASLAREELAPFSAQLAARLRGAAQAGQATPTEDDARRPPTG